jgi:hypothetical protein
MQAGAEDICLLYEEYGTWNSVKKHVKMNSDGLIWMYVSTHGMAEEQYYEARTDE